MKKNLLLIGLLSISAGAMADNTINLKFQWTGANANSVISNVNVQRAPIICAGDTSNTDYPNGYVVSNLFVPGQNNDFAIQVSGNFPGDQRNICQINKGNSNFEDVYFTIQNTLITYNVNGAKDECLIPSVIGTSFYSGSRENNELHSNTENLVEPCVGSKFGITFKAVPGGLSGTYKAGQIELNVPDAIVPESGSESSPAA